MATDTMHIGRKISRIREIKGMKQETLASVLGVSQQTVSKLEQSEHIDDDRLDEVSKALGVPVEAIRNFDEEKAVNFISNIFNDASAKGAFFSSTNSNCTFNPIEELIKMVEENKKLYERLLQSEREKVELLQQVIGKK